MLDKIEHLKIIQGVITRMATNSFLLKGWTVTLVSALFALADRTKSQNFFVLAYFPALVFWILDAYYLSKERAFRELYDSVRNAAGDESDFSMHVGSSASNWALAFVAKVNWPFYSVIAAVILLAIMLN